MYMRRTQNSINLSRNYRIRDYSHIRQDERLEIAILLKKGYSTRDIAVALGRSPSSISSEVRRNRMGYELCRYLRYKHIRRGKRKSRYIIA